MESWVGTVHSVAGGFLKRENLSSAVDSGLPRYHIRRYRLELVFRTKLCKTGTQQVPSRVPSYYYILAAKGSGLGVLWDAADADRGAARANHATHARAT